jgi:hypothetical protein
VGVLGQLKILKKLHRRAIFRQTFTAVSLGVLLPRFPGYNKGHPKKA